MILILAIVVGWAVVTLLIAVVVARVFQTQAPYMDTHYLPDDAPTRGRGRHRQQRALCGVWCDLGAHTVDPSCVVCAQLVDQEEALAAARLQQWDAEAAQARTRRTHVH